MGGGVFSDEYLSRLDAEIETTYDSLMRHNAAKNVFSGFRTPAVLGVIAAALYLLAGLLGMLGLLSLANCCNFALIAVVVLSAFWIYARFTGNYAEIATQIDSLANVVHQVSICDALTVAYEAELFVRLFAGCVLTNVSTIFV